MSETLASTPTTPTSPSKESEKKLTGTPSNGLSTKKFEGEGLPFKGKLIGMEDISVDRDEKICLDAMFKLKAVVRARGEHKQKIQLNLTMTAVKVIDDATKAQIASHEIERISFVVIDPRDNRAFGYIYNTSDDRHQFWAIKTERAAAATVLALKELFELAFEEYSKGEKAKESAKPTTTSSPSTSPAPQPTTTVPTSSPAPAPPAAPVVSVPTPQPSTASILDGDIWGDSASTTTAQQTQPNFNNLWDTTQASVPNTQGAPKTSSGLEDMFGELSTTTPTSPPVTTAQTPASTAPPNALFGLFSNPNPTPASPPSHQFGNLYPSVTQSNPSYNNNPIFPQQQPQPMTFPSPISTPQQQQPMTFPPPMSTPQQQPMAYPPMSVPQPQQNLLNPAPSTPIAPPTVTSPFAEFDLLGGLSSSTTKPTKDLFFPGTPAKTMQQMQMEKKP